jgi:5-formyltetrahydrofolate cyclo-ligase
MDFEEKLAAAEKIKIRLAMRAARDKLDYETRESKNASIMEKVMALDEYRSADSVMGYVAFGSEVDPSPSMRIAAGEGKRVMIPDFFGLLELTGVFAERAEAGEVDLALIPAIAFDERGYRLGYGGGWYDRFSTKMKEGAKLVGIAFEEQITKELPNEAHDLLLDMIITDSRLIKPAKT